MRTLSYIRLISFFTIILLSAFPIKNHAQEILKQESETVRMYRQQLSRSISRMTGLGCDTLQMQRMLRELAGLKEGNAVNRTVLSAGTDIALQSAINEPGNYLNIPDTYQWYVSPDGNDNNPGTQQAPLKNIQTAIEQASSGDAIKIAPGKYTETLYINKNVYLFGSVECPQSVVIEPYTDYGGIEISYCSPEIHGITIIKATTGIYINSAYPFFSHLIITQSDGPALSAVGQYFSYVMCNSLIYENNAWDNPVMNHAPSGQNAAAYADICNVTITDNRGSVAIQSWGGFFTFYLLNNILYNTETIREISIQSMNHSAEVQYCLIRNKNEYYNISSLDGVIDNDPFFDIEDLSEGRYRLLNHSPCIDAGTPDFYDYSSPPGKGGSRSDMGAYGWESRMTNICRMAAPGDDFASAIEMGTYDGSFLYEDTRNIDLYTNQYPWPGEGPDVFYRFSTTVTMDIEINHCGSEAYDTYVALLSTTAGILHESHDPPATIPCNSGSGEQAGLLIRNLPAGTYYVLSKSFSTGNNDELTTTVRGSMPGDTYHTPIHTATVPYNKSFLYTDTRNTSLYSNAYNGQSTNDVFYRFTTSKAMNVEISHCGSGLDNTYLHLLNEAGTRIDYNDDYSGEGACNSSLHAYLKKTELPAGTYYVVSEGYSDNGEIMTRIKGTVKGDAFDYPFEAGTFDAPGTYRNTLNMGDFTNTYEGTSYNDVFYRFTLTTPMAVEISHVASVLTRLTLLRSGGEVYTYSTGGDNISQQPHLYINWLAAGTYYVVSEGTNGNGVIETKIEVDLPEPEVDPVCNHNYIQTIVPLQEFNAVPPETMPSASQHMITMEYFDGLGRPLQSVAVGASPDGSDIITPVAYDEFGRETVKYLPYKSPASDGQFRIDALAEQAYFYHRNGNGPADVAKDNYPYAVTVLEMSPLDKVIKQGNPGGDWHPDYGRTHRFWYNTNTWNDIQAWLVLEDGFYTPDDFYSEGTLYRTDMVDENNHLSYEYKDKQGRVVMTGRTKPDGQLS
ncbi:MAG: DUF1565 domain-containing protein, partial [Bacteroidales bacterium]|nr:DUF1565 domain-containing protein [Bacteroidales bacterium]